MGRKGLPAGTKINQDSMRKSNELLQDNMPMKLDMEVGSFSLPHPFKKDSGVAMSRRLYGAGELSEDLSLCEDAHFALKMKSASTTAMSSSYIYLCVADGVGSWRQFGIDPRAFSHRYLDTILYLVIIVVVIDI